MRSRFMVSAVLAAAVLGGCNKDETTPTNPGGPSTKPTSKPTTTQPAVVVPPVLPPTITPAIEDAAKRAAEALKNHPTTLPTGGRVPTTLPALPTN